MPSCVHGSGSGETGATGQKLTVAGSSMQSCTTSSTSSIPGFSSEQVSSLVRLISDMIETKFDQRFAQFEAKMEQRFGRLEDNLTPSIENGTHTPSTPSPGSSTTQEHERRPLHEQEHRSDHHCPHQNVDIEPTELRAKDIGFFDPDYQDGTTGPITSMGKYVLYRDVYVFVDRLHDVAYNHGDATTKTLVQECLRGNTALMWYLSELTHLEKAGLRAANLQAWCDALIARFKMRTSAAIAALTSQSSSYGLPDLKQQSPRAWIHQMLRYARAAGFDSMPARLTLVWNKLDVDLRRDIPVPTEKTTLGRFLEDIDGKTSIWEELADRAAKRQSQSRRRYPPRYQAPPQQPGNPFQHQAETGYGGPYQGGDTRGYPQRPGNGQAYFPEGPDDGYAPYDEYYA